MAKSKSSLLPHASDISKKFQQTNSNALSAFMVTADIKYFSTDFNSLKPKNDSATISIKNLNDGEETEITSFTIRAKGRQLKPAAEMLAERTLDALLQAKDLDNLAPDELILRGFNNARVGGSPHVPLNLDN